MACAAAVQKGAKAKPRDGGARAREVSETEFMMRKREVEWSTEGRRAGKRGERGVDAVVRAGVPRCSAAGVLTPQCRRSAAPVYTSRAIRPMQARLLLATWVLSGAARAFTNATYARTHTTRARGP